MASLGVWCAIAVAGIVSCKSPETSTTPENHADQVAGARASSSTVTVSPYGELPIADGELVVMDHNSGDHRVHAVTLSPAPDRPGSTLSWADRPGPRTEIRTDTVPLVAEQRDQIRYWSRQLWELAPAGRRSLEKPAPPAGAAGYEWAAAVRRGDEVRVIDGGRSGPDWIESLIDFLDMQF